MCYLASDLVQIFDIISYMENWIEEKKQLIPLNIISILW